MKKFNSPNYNYVFNEKTGFFARWGKTMDDDPQFSPFGPEILDIELSTICSKGCAFCYKSNKKAGKNMSLETFKQIVPKFPKTLTQIAFGIGDIDANPDLFPIMEYCRMNGIVPNITINGERMTPHYYDLLVALCGAVAVSHYDDEACFRAVYELTKRGLEQVNIHSLLSQETVGECERLLTTKDPRLVGLNAVVFLWLKPKGQRNNLHQVTKEDYQKLIKVALASGRNFGFDSCSAHNFERVIKDNPAYTQLMQTCEPCESSCFSYYINAEAMAYPCSFAEGKVSGDNLLEKDFTQIWKDNKFRKTLLENKRQCPLYKLEIGE